MSDKVRILICHNCESLEEIPHYEGPPEYDHLLEYKVSQHRFADGNEHFGDLAVVDAKDWNNKNVRAEIIKKLNEAVSPGQAEGLGSKFYNLKSNFQQDAMTCWKRHSRTTDCGDYRRDSKRLVPDTAADRKDIGLSPTARPNTWLCDFCPVQTIVDKAKNKKKGF